MRIRGPIAAAVFSAALVGMATSQPPPGEGPPPGKEKGKIELGRVFPKQLRGELKLTSEQQKEVLEIEKDVKTQLEKLLTAEQKKTFESFVPGGPGGRPPLEVVVEPPPASKVGLRIIVHGALKTAGNPKITLVGDAMEGTLGDQRREHNGGGIRLLSGEDLNKDGKSAGEFTTTIVGVKEEKGRWYRIRVYGLAQEAFTVDKDDLYVKVEFAKKNGTNSLDYIKKSIYAQVELERKSLLDAGTNKNLGPATWRNYSIDVRTPFPEVDTLKVSVGFANGTGKGKPSEFWVSEVEVLPIPDPAGYAPPAKPATDKNPPALKNLVKLGGRWYFDPRDGDKTPPKQFDHTNVDRLYFLTDRLETPPEPTDHWACLADETGHCWL